MRVRLKGPGGTATLTLEEDAIVGNLISQIKEATSISSFEVKYGFPPKALPLEQNEPSKRLKDLDVKLSGETLTIIPKEDPTSDNQSTPNESPFKTPQKGTTASAPTVSFAGMESTPKKETTKPVSLQKKAMAGEVPEVPLPERGATLGMLLTSRKVAQIN